jgi:maltooligosyltrehalose trehalohydrolase
VHVALTGETTGYYADFEPLSALAKVLEHGFFHDGTYSSFRERNHGHPIDTEHMPGWRLVVANQNHDQIGNRATGDRLAATLDDGQLAIAAALTLLGPFTPMLFMGEEWAASTPWQFFTSHPEKDLGIATAKGRIAEFTKMGWDESVVPDPQDPATFADSKLVWSELEQGRHARLLDWYRMLGTVRRAHPDFTTPRLPATTVSFDAAERWVAIHRGGSGLVVTLGDGEHVHPLPDGCGVIASFGAVAVEHGSARLGAHSVAVWAPVA